MAVVVSHAMRRFASSPDAKYSCGLRSEPSCPRSWSQDKEGALSRSMRYADPWLYEGVRPPPSGLLLAPAFVLCTCNDYLTGSKKPSKKAPSTCKKCKGTRIPLPASGESAKFGTMRCYPSPTVTTPSPRAGTMRAVSSTTSSRPSILPAADPYDLMRRSRMTVSEKKKKDGHLRARSISPRAHQSNATRPKFSTVGRRSILECSINPYELMATGLEMADGGVTLVNGQRIRVRPAINTSIAPEYEDVVQLKTPRSQIPKLQMGKLRASYRPPPPPPPTSSSRFKSILKKPSCDADVSIERSPSPCYSTGSQYGFPSPRKKVQFREDGNSTGEDVVQLADNIDIPTTDGAPPTSLVAAHVDEGNTPTQACRLRRSESERALKEAAVNKVIFHDSMALRSQQSRVDARIVFASKKDLVHMDSGIEQVQKVQKVPKVQLSPTPPSAPPRKRGVNKSKEERNRTIVRINNNKNGNEFKVKIKNESPLEVYDTFNVNTITINDQHLGKTSIMINGDDCYSTIKVCDEVPVYHSSVVVTDCGSAAATPEKRNSSVYINGNSSLSTTTINVNDDTIVPVDSGEAERQRPEEEHRLQMCLSDPVEAVRLNLVPHVCGRADPPRRPRDSERLGEPLADLETLSEEDRVAQFVHESIMKMRTCKVLDMDDKDSEHSSSTQYELIDHASDCYTDHSNRSSITEEELNARTKFYEMLADSAIVEVAENEDHHYECIKINPDPIYEEIEIPPPLPANPPPTSLLDELQIDKEYTTRSIFEGASKYDILSYLVDAKERGIVPEDSYTYHFDTPAVNSEEDGKDPVELPYNRVSHLSSVSDSSEDSSLVMSSCSLTDDKVQRSAEVERNDSGVGSETSKSSLSKYRTKPDVINVTCEDCEASLDSSQGPCSDHEPLICRKCVKKRTERKEIITEIVETEEKYSRDLQIILEEFYQPMLVAGLLTSDQLSAIFLNVEELLENSQALAERLRDAVEIAGEQGDEDLQTVNIGKLVLEAAPMLHAFETYCVRQGAASLLLASLEKDKELLRIFLRVSQMENTVLRRMNLNSFLMVPVQRVTKYPLLLARLHKVTPPHFENREQLKEAQTKIELHLNHMNSETKDVPSKLWRRISSIPGRRSSSEMDLVNIKLRKIAVDVLEWNHDEAKFALEGKLLFTQPTDNNWRKGRTIKLTPINALLVTNGKAAATRSDSSGESLVFSRQAGVRDAALLLVRDKNGRYTLLREPLYLDRCVIAADPAWQSYFEVQELLGKDTFIFKAEDEEQTKLWYRQLQYYAQGMGTWRKRRNALANIMINGMGLRA